MIFTVLLANTKLDNQFSSRDLFSEFRDLNFTLFLFLYHTSYDADDADVYKNKSRCATYFDTNDPWKYFAVYKY